MSRIAIKEKDSGATLAESLAGDDPLRYEGNWYFAPESVDSAALVVSDRTYRCPIKGVCNWVDFRGGDGRVIKDVAWIYPEPKPGHEAIRGRFGFYAGSRGPTREESAEGR